VSTPSIFTEPLRRGTIPMIDFMVVVFPAPLRPTNVTSSPLRTSRSTPWSTCDSPYQAWSLLTESSASGMLGAQVGGDDCRVLRDRLVVPFGEHFAAGEDGDLLREARDDSEVVLHHQDGAVLGHTLDEGRDAIDVLVTHSGGGLVEQHQLGVERERGGDLQRPLAAVGEFRRQCLMEVAQSHRGEQLLGAGVELAEHPVALPEVEGPAPLALERDPDVFQG